MDYKVALRCGMFLMKRILNRMEWRDIHFKQTNKQNPQRKKQKTFL